MPIYGPTGGDFALRGRTLGEGLSGMAQNMGQMWMQRAALREEKRQAEFLQTYKMMNDMVNSENYKGDWTKFFSKNPSVTKKLLSTMYPYNPDQVEWVYEGLKSGNQSAQQQTTQAIEETWKELNAAQWERQQQQQANQEMGDQGLPQGTVSPTGGQDIWKMVQQQGQQGGPPAGGGEPGSISIDMPIGQVGGTTEQTNPVVQKFRSQAANTPEGGEDGERVSTRERGGLLPTREQLKETIDTTLEKFGPGAKSPLVNLLKATKYGLERGEEKREPKEIVEELQDAADKEGVALSGPSVDINSFVKQAHNDYMDQGGDNNFQVASKEAIGINRNDIQEASRQLQDGDIENPDVLSFMNKFGLEKNATGLAQAATIMHAAMLGKPVPKSVDQNLMLGAGYAQQHYPELMDQLGVGGEQAVSGPVEGPKTPPKEVLPEKSGMEQFQESLEKKHPGSDVNVHNEDSDYFYFKIDGNILRMRKETAIDRGHVQVDPAAKDAMRAFDLDGDTTMTVSEYMNNPLGVKGKKKRKAENAISKISVRVDRLARQPETQRAYAEAGNDVIQQIASMDIDPLVKTAIATMPGNTDEEKMGIFMASQMPQNIKEEKRFQELIRQFDLTHDLNWAKLKTEYAIAMMQLTASRGMEQAIDRMANAELQKAGIETAGKTLLEMTTKIYEEDPDKFNENFTKIFEESGYLGDVKKMFTTINASIMNLPVEMVKKNLPNRNIPFGALFSKFGADFAQVELETPALNWENYGMDTGEGGPAETVEEDEFYQSLSEDLNLGQ